MSKFNYTLEDFEPQFIRNFSVIAHIDHGKSTLCDRLLEITGTLSTRVKNEQFLDKLQIEKERGITVKAQTASMVWEYNGKKYLLNLIDTPGHVDFSYEVSRSLYACQGALLLVDATQGVEAQTMANFYLAFNQDLTILPVINKIDVISADPERIKGEMHTLFDYNDDDFSNVSGKTGLGVTELLNKVIEKIPSPKGSLEKNFKALLFDSWYDEYKGVIILVAIHDGIVKKGDKITLNSTGLEYEVLEIGIMYPEQVQMNALYPGQVGYIIPGMKTVREAHIGDTVHHRKQEIVPFGGFRPPRPMVFAGIFPVLSDDFELLRDAIEKLTLNDASVKVEKTHSNALGIGFRCGFLGLLHMEVFQQRLEQEYNVNVIATAPNVLYKVILKSGEEVFIETPAEFPEPTKIESVLEPMIKATLLLPKEYVGVVIDLCQKKRGNQLDFSFLTEERAILVYQLPLNEVAIDFYDQLKSLTSGYASLDYEEAGYQENKLVKMDILLNSRPVDALSVIVHVDRAYYIGKDLVERLREVIERQMFEVVIQAAVGAKILCRASISAFRKDVISHCYGGDITRKNKLLDKQKEGKKKMKQIGNIEVPQEAFLAILNKKGNK